MLEPVPYCRHCNAHLSQAGRGRPRQYCSDRCRKAAYERRNVGWTYLNESEPAHPAVMELAAILSGASADEDVVDAVLALVALAAEFRRHGVAARPQLAARCTHVARGLDALIAEHLGDLVG